MNKRRNDYAAGMVEQKERQGGKEPGLLSSAWDGSMGAVGRLVLGDQQWGNQLYERQLLDPVFEPALDLAPDLLPAWLSYGNWICDAGLPPFMLVDQRLGVYLPGLGRFGKDAHEASQAI